jgi:putative tricarboxylic transport membrane protein
VARRDLVVALVTLAFGVAAAHQAAQLPFGTVHNPGAGFVPWLLALVFTLLALVLVAQAVARRPGPAADAAGRLRKVVALLAALALYVVLLEPVGYPIATFLLVLFMLRVLEPHRWPLALGLALLAAGGSYVLFAVWLSVPLPPGLLGR